MQEVHLPPDLKFRPLTIDSMRPNLIPASFGGLNTTQPYTIFEHREDPELIIRKDRSIPFGSNAVSHFEVVQEATAEAIDTVRVLHNQYGIHSPNFVIIGIADPTEEGEACIYSATSRVHGRYFALEHLHDASHPEWLLHEMPENITVETFNKIMTYYEDVADGKVDNFLADLRLGNLNYGRLKGDQDDHVYLFDLGLDGFFTPHDKHWALKQAIERPKSSNAPGLSDLARDLQAMQQAYTKDYPEFQRRLEALKNKVANL